MNPVPRRTAPGRRRACSCRAPTARFAPRSAVATLGFPRTLHLLFRALDGME